MRLARVVCLLLLMFGFADLGEAAEDFDHMVTPEERYRIAMSRQ